MIQWGTFEYVGVRWVMLGYVGVRRDTLVYIGISNIPQPLPAYNNIIKWLQMCRNVTKCKKHNKVIGRFDVLEKSGGWWILHVGRSQLYYVFGMVKLFETFRKLTSRRYRGRPYRLSNIDSRLNYGQKKRNILSNGNIGILSTQLSSSKISLGYCGSRKIHCTRWDIERWVQ